MGRKRLHRNQTISMRFSESELDVIIPGAHKGEKIEAFRNLMADGLRWRIGEDLPGDLYAIIRLMSKLRASASPSAQIRRVDAKYKADA